MRVRVRVVCVCVTDFMSRNRTMGTSATSFFAIKIASEAAVSLTQ